MRRPWAWPLAPVYRAGLALREIGLRSGIAATRRLQWPVVSIGNLSTGGSGKTPLTIALAKALTARGVPVDVLSRGYRRHAEGTARVDPNGTAAEFGDEPLEIARATGVPVYVAAQRYEAGALAERSGLPGSELPGFGLHLLDDGFQHRQLARDVDILLMSAWDLEDHLLPAGNLREPLRAAKRADVIAIPAGEGDLESAIQARGWRETVWRVKRRMDVPQIEGPVAAFCGIARPEQFFAGLEAAGLRVAARLAFGDHHSYSGGDIERIANEARSVGAATILTTEKDRVRMGALAGRFTESLAVQSVPLRIEIENEAAAIGWLMKRIADPRGQRESPR